MYRTPPPPQHTKQILFLAFSPPQRNVRGAMLRVVPSVLRGWLLFQQNNIDLVRNGLIIKTRNSKKKKYDKASDLEK